MQGRFNFFETFAEHTEFYQSIANPLLSMHIVGIIDFEQRIKPIKHNILTKKHIRLHDPKSVALYRSSENLKHIMDAKLILQNKITDSLV